MRQSINLLLLLLPLSAPAATFDGAVTKITRAGGVNTVFFRDATSDFEFDLDKVSPELKKQLEENATKRERIQVEIPDSLITNKKGVPRGIRNDCSELPISMDELNRIGNDPKVKNIEDFLRAIPPGTLQGFTFVTNSKSAQKGNGETGVSEMWPRVLRTSIDGKITFSYTCNPNSETHNQIEVIYYEDDKFKTSRILLSNPPGEGKGKRIHENPQVCVKCHSNGTVAGETSLRPNWPEYFFWGDCAKRRGITFYGMSDDNMVINQYRSRIPTSNDSTPQGCNSSSDQQTHTSLVQDFEKFKEMQKDNPCYSLLPWAKNDGTNDGWNYSAYPYSTNAQEMRQEPGSTGPAIGNYTLRNNARLTDTYSHLMSSRIQKLLKRTNPVEYDRLKYFIAMEGANCLTAEDEAKAKAAVPGFEIRKDLGTSNVAYTDPRGKPLLYNFALRSGLKPSDWTMTFDKNEANASPAYNAVMFMGQSEEGFQDASIRDVVAGEVIKDIASTDPKIAEVAKGKLTRGASGVFGEKFSCIDDLGGAVKTNERGGDKALCKALHEENEKHQARLDTVKNLEKEAQACVDQTRADNSVTMLVDAVAQIQIEMQENDNEDLQASIKRGHELVQGGKANCVRCHGASDKNVDSRPKSFLFVPMDAAGEGRYAEQLATLKSRVKEGFLDEISSQIFGGEMPQGQELTDAERKDVFNYLKSLVGK